MGGGGGGSGGDSRNEIRYAPFVENQYQRLMYGNADDVDGFKQYGVWRILQQTFDHSKEGLLPSTTPYTNYAAPRIEDGFFGSGLSITNFASLMTYIQTYLQDQSPQVLWQQTYNEVVQGTVVNDSIAAHAALVDNEVITTMLPRLVGGLRDINAVQSSAFVVGKALVQQQQVRLVNDYSAKLRVAMVELSGRLWGGKLEWYRTIPALVKDVYLAYYQDKIEYETQKMEFAVKDRLFNLTLFDDVRSAVGALNGAAASGGSQGRSNMPSQGVRALASGISMAATGASVGSSVAAGTSVGSSAGGIYGAIIGAAVGVGMAYLQ